MSGRTYRKSAEEISFLDVVVRHWCLQNTAHECDLEPDMRRAISAYPKTQAVLVRRHGIYIWGKDWKQAKAQAESYDFLFKAVLQMKSLGIDPKQRPKKLGSDHAKYCVSSVAAPPKSQVSTSSEDLSETDVPSASEAGQEGVKRPRIN